MFSTESAGERNHRLENARQGIGDPRKRRQRTACRQTRFMPLPGAGACDRIVTVLLTALLALILSACTSLPFTTGRAESLDCSAGWEERRNTSPADCAEVDIIADFQSREIEDQALLNMKHLCILHNGRQGISQTADRVIVDAQIRERSFMKDLKMRRSVSLVLTVTDDEGEYLARYIFCIEGKRTIESAPWLFGLQKKGFGKLFP